MRYHKINKYILSIELLEDSIHDENRDNIINPEFATYHTNKFKIVEIQNMINNTYIDKLYNYKMNDIIKKNIIYSLSREKAFYTLDYDYFIETYQLIDKLYYINFYRENSLIYNGIHRTWYDSGQLKEEFYHIDGIYEGIYTSYDENGNINKKYIFVNNKIVA
jgi:antitoxin component YwqK of YwqJK toxin-antitoxin module